MRTNTGSCRASTGRATRAANGASKTAKRWVGYVVGLLLTSAATNAQAQNADVYTYHNDTLRTGWQQNEATLTTSNAGQLTLLYNVKVNGRITRSLSSFPSSP